MEIWAPTYNSVTGPTLQKYVSFYKKKWQNVSRVSMKNRKTTDVVQRFRTMCSGGQYLHSKYGARHWKSDLDYCMLPRAAAWERWTFFGIWDYPFWLPPLPGNSWLSRENVGLHMPSSYSQLFLWGKRGSRPLGIPNVLYGNLYLQLARSCFLAFSQFMRSHPNLSGKLGKFWWNSYKLLLVQLSRNFFSWQWPRTSRLIMKKK